MQGVREEHQHDRNYRPLELRIDLHRSVIELVRLGLTHRQTQDAIFAQKQVHLSKSTISEWARGIHRPLGRVNSFRDDPSPELAYVIGVVLSDGNLNIHGYNAEVLLSVTDQDFAEEFSRCLAKVLHREKPYRVRYSEKRNRWIVQGSSILLHRFLSSNWKDLRKYIEHCEACEAAFLRAFYDGEGCISQGQLSLANTNLELLSYAKELLRRFDVETLDPHVTSRTGTVLKDSRTGKNYQRRKDCYIVVARTRSVAQFARHIGFTIRRKQTLLEDSTP